MHCCFVKKVVGCPFVCFVFCLLRGTVMGVRGVSEFVGYRTRLRDGIESSSNVNRLARAVKHHII